MFRFLVIFWLQLAGYSGLQWAERFQDNSGPMEVCSGQNIRLFWNFTLAQDEHVKDMVWTCQPEGNATELLASCVDDTFVPMSEFSGRLSHLQDGGIELSCATIMDSGNYSVTVNTVDNNGDETLYRQTAWVKVVDTPKTQDGQLEVRQEREAVRDDTSDRQWHVHLTCGHFFDLGHPAVDVEWKTPNGETLSSSYFHKGNFHLLLSNPVKGGNYTCSLSSLSPATRCLPPGSALRDDTIYMDEMAARLSIIEAQQLQMQDDVIGELQSQMEDLKFRLEQRAALRAVLRTTHITTNAPIKMAPLQQTASDYDNTTGVYIVPVSGWYSVAFQLFPMERVVKLDVDLYNNENRVARARCSDSASITRRSFSCHSSHALHLNGGDRLSVRSDHPGPYYTSIWDNFLTVVLISPDH